MTRFVVLYFMNLPSLQLLILHTYEHGRNLAGDTGDVSRHFFIRGYMICHIPPHFSLRVCIWRGFKTKCDVCHVLCEEFFMLDFTHSKVFLRKMLGTPYRL